MRTVVFNADNKQRQVKNASGVPIGTYYYDGEGKRVKKVTNLETTVYLYSGGKLIAEYSTATPPANPTTNYTVTDMLGSPRVLTNSLGEVVSRRDFAPFGEEIFADTHNRTTADNYSNTGEDAVRKPFTGYEKDMETGLDFAENRMYENRDGRFTAVDPLLASGKSANPQTFNRYVYVLSNPLVLIDPNGLQVAKVPGGRWYQPIDQDGVKTYRFESTQPDGYKPVTERNTKGDLIGTFTAGMVGGERYWVLKFDERGPLVSQPIVDVRTNKSEMYRLTDDERNGFSIVRGPDFKWTGAVETAISPGDIAFAFTPFKFSVGGRASLAAAESGFTATSWNQFQRNTAGQFTSRLEASKAWSSYKLANGIESRAVIRDQAQRSIFLKDAAESGMYPKWMNQWLRNGQTPPGHSIDHIKPLSIGGEDLPSNMRLLDNDFHFKIHHRFYRPWEP